MNYFIDKRTNELRPVDENVLNFLAPEMYHYYNENKNNMFTETWCVGQNQYIDVAYNQIDIDSNLVNIKRENIFREHNVEPIFLRNFSVPTEIYKKILEEFGYQYKED